MIKLNNYYMSCKFIMILIGYFFFFLKTPVFHNWFVEDMNEFILEIEYE